MATLMPYQKTLLDLVLTKAEGREVHIDHAIRATLDGNRQSWRGVNYGYLYRTLAAAAKAKIRIAKKRAEAGKRPKLVLTA